MAPRKVYYKKGDAFSEWHRIHIGWACIDIDWVETCKRCKKILFIGETAVDKGHNRKATYITEDIAERLGVVGYLVFYKLNNREEIVGFRVKQIYPRKNGFTNYTPEMFEDFISHWHMGHDKSCPVLLKKNEDN